MVSLSKDEQDMMDLFSQLKKPEAPPQRRVTPMFKGYEIMPEGDDEYTAWIAQFPLRAQGRNLVTANTGVRYKLKGVNWYGASDCCHVVGGLDKASLKDICWSIRSMGFNCVRLPFSNEMLRVSENSSKREDVTSSINFTLNPSLLPVANDPLALFDAVVASLGAMRIAVVLNNHTTFGQWSGGVELNGLWFDEREGSNYTEESWIADWVFLANRYKNLKFVCGFDLRNECRPRSLLKPSQWPFWGNSALVTTTPSPRPASTQPEDDGGKSLVEDSADGDDVATPQAKAIARRWSLAAASAPAPSPKSQQRTGGRNSTSDWCRAAGAAARALIIENNVAGFIVVERIAWPQNSAFHKKF